MNEITILTVLVVGVALAFDFVNGFHDAANSIATLVATKVLKPLHAVLWAAFFNFSALFFFGTGVAKTVGSGMIALDSVTPTVILAGLLGAIAWGLITWWLRMPTSSSHSLLGGYGGAAICNSALHNGWINAYKPILAAGWYRTLVFIVVAPVLAMILAQILMKLTMVVQKKFPSSQSDKIF
jgi:PiT family inorganic phosphate transporter